MKVVIVGGVAGGATAAARLRRLDESAEIVMLERTGYVSYANCGLPYYIGGTIEDREELTLQTPESFKNRFNIDVRVHHEVTEIHPAEHTLTVRRLDDGSEYTEGYDKLILSPGAKAIRPPLPGIDHERIFTLRTVEDTFRIREFLDREQPRRAVVVGGGFIGLEMAENLIGSGIETTLIQLDDQVLLPLDKDLAGEVQSYLRGQGLRLRLGTAVTGFAPDGAGLKVLIGADDPVPADLVILAIGVAPESDLARRAGLTLGQKGAIAVNDQMQTSDPDIYAVGDAVELTHAVTGRKTLVALAGPANRQGRVAADSICGIGDRYAGAQGSSILKLFEMTAAATGLNERAAKAAGLDYEVAITYSASHAGYYPGAKNMTVKTLFEPTTGRILGAGIVGFDGVDKRIDVLATAIRAGLTARQLTELDLAYAPPYSSAKDPVNMAGYVIENLRAGLVSQYRWDEVASLPTDGSVTLLDVRTPEEVAEQGLIRPDAVNIPLDELRGRLSELDPAKPLYVNCYSGLRSYLACRILSQRGFVCYNLAGGWRFWSYSSQDRVHDATPTHPCGLACGS
ncbi:MAG TPA: FAD-dependent oxidoreductase [Candidatus Pygmaiobacter gallistercoris]|nr:FAD-dependent oxidoreductase [Candidatus Pygmaiobacter gallistercoris]